MAPEQPRGTDGLAVNLLVLCLPLPDACQPSRPLFPSQISYSSSTPPSSAHYSLLLLLYTISKAHSMLKRLLLALHPLESTGEFTFYLRSSLLPSSPSPSRLDRCHTKPHTSPPPMAASPSGPSPPSQLKRSTHNKPSSPHNEPISPPINTTGTNHTSLPPSNHQYREFLIQPMMCFCQVEDRVASPTVIPERAAQGRDPRRT